MGLDVSESLKVLKPLRAKLVKKLNKDAQPLWDDFLKNTDDSIAELEKIEASGYAKTRADYEKKKAELDKLKIAVNSSSASAMAGYRKAIESRNRATTLMNALGKVMKDDKDPAYKDYRAGFAYGNNAIGRFPDGEQLGPIE